MQIKAKALHMTSLLNPLCLYNAACAEIEPCSPITTIPTCSLFPRAGLPIYDSEGFDTMNSKCGNKVSRRMHDDADTVGNSLTNLLMMNGLVHNPPVGPEEDLKCDRCS